MAGAGGGALKGAAAGASVGAAFGGVGAAVGAVVGAIAGAISGLFGNKKKKKLKKAIRNEQTFQRDKALEINFFQEAGQDIQMARAQFQIGQERIQAVREARIRRGEVIASAANANAQTSTVGQTLADNPYTQLLAGIGVQNVFAGYASWLGDINDEISSRNEDVINSQFRLGQFQARLGRQIQKDQLFDQAMDNAASLAGTFGGYMNTSGGGNAGGSYKPTGFSSATSSNSKASNTFNYFGNYQNGSAGKSIFNFK